MTNYSYSTQLNISFDEAIEVVISSLTEEGFGVLTDIDVSKTFKEKLDIDFQQYRILGACSPSRALKALQAEEEIGLLLPCNVIVYEKDDVVVVSAIKPSIAFTIVNNKEIEDISNKVDGMLKRVIERL